MAQVLQTVPGRTVIKNTVISRMVTRDAAQMENHCITLYAEMDRHDCLSLE